MVFGLMRSGRLRQWPWPWVFGDSGKCRAFWSCFAFTMKGRIVFHNGRAFVRGGAAVGSEEVEAVV